MIWVAIMYFLVGLAKNVTAALWVKFVKDVIGLTAAQIGMATSAYFISALLSSPLLGYAADRYGRGTVSLLSLLAGILGCAVYVFWSDFYAVLIASALLGISIGLLNAVEAWGVERYGEGVVGRGYAALRAGALIGGVLSGLLFTLDPRVPWIVRILLFLVLWSVIGGKVGGRARGKVELRREAWIVILFSVVFGFSTYSLFLAWQYLLPGDFISLSLIWVLANLSMILGNEIGGRVRRGTRRYALALSLPLLSATIILFPSFPSPLLLALYEFFLGLSFVLLVRVLHTGVGDGVRGGARGTMSSALSVGRLGMSMVVAGTGDMGVACMIGGGTLLLATLLLPIYLLKRRMLS